MKKQTFIFMLFALMTAGSIQAQDTKNAATVTKEQGIYIFMCAEPVTPYDYLGTVKAPAVTMGGTFEESLTVILKRVKKDYPQAEAIIFNSSNSNKVDAIRFK